MARKLTSTERDALHAPAAKPQGWESKWAKPGRRPVRTAESFDLTETIILRHLAVGESGHQIAKHIGMTAGGVNGIIKLMLERHGVDTRRELLALDIVKKALAQ